MYNGDNMSGIESVPSAYLSIGFLAILGIIMPLTNFLITWVVRPKVDPARPHITKSYLLEGYEVDHSLYPRRLTTFECGSEPVGDAMIQFHFQYYWYAIIFLVFDVAFMFLVLGGMVVGNATSTDLAENNRETAVEDAKMAMMILAIFFSTMSAGVWYVFRKRGRIYI
jgi:NADH:ubiquinone oxidoreductase subunit 3 (subunit A)